MSSEPQVNFEEPDQNQLAVIVQKSGLEQSKAKYILERFQDYFTLADEMTNLTKTIKVMTKTAMVTTIIIATVTTTTVTFKSCSKKRC